MSGARTKSKLAWALRTEHGGYGLICADRTEHLVPWESGLYDCFEQTVTDVLTRSSQWQNRLPTKNPVRPGSHRVPWPCTRVFRAPPLATLTASELEVARLVAKGMSYKAIARVRDRSLSTIDHQLRSIRQDRSLEHIGFGQPPCSGGFVSSSATGAVAACDASLHFPMYATSIGK